MHAQARKFRDIVDLSETFLVNSNDRDLIPKEANVKGFDNAENSAKTESCCWGRKGTIGSCSDNRPLISKVHAWVHYQSQNLGMNTF